MADEVKWTYETQVTLEDNGGAVSVDAFANADDVDLTSANHADYPYADMVLACAFAAGVGAYSNVNLYRRDHNIDGANDSPAPASGYKSLFVGSFMIPTSASTKAYYPLPNLPLSADCDFYIENKADQELSSGWDLKATPKTFVPGT